LSPIWIIDKFQLIGIPTDRIEIDKVISVLSDESKRIELAKELEEANQEGKWYWTDHVARRIFKKVWANI
jgi:hypothetical protein